MIKKILKELKDHLPFTFFATITAVIITVLLFTKTSLNFEPAFELFHPLHILASSIVTSAIYYKYKKNVVKALLVGLVGSILIGTLSDIILPYLGGNLLHLKTHLHLPIIENPLLIIATALLGSIIGIKSLLTKMPHFIHVFLSVFASLFYLIAFSPNLNLVYLTISGIIVFIAVLIPCCVSDIIFPLVFIKNKIKKS